MRNHQGSEGPRFNPPICHCPLGPGETAKNGYHLRRWTPDLLYDHWLRSMPSSLSGPGRKDEANRLWEKSRNSTLVGVQYAFARCPLAEKAHDEYVKRLKVSQRNTSKSVRVADDEVPF